MALDPSKPATTDADRPDLDVSLSAAELEARYAAHRRKAATAAGPLLGALAFYGVFFVTRPFDRGQSFGTYAFLVGIPLAMAVTPYFFADRRATYQRFLVAYLVLISLLGLLWVTGAESGLCLALITLPWVTALTLVLWIVNRVAARRIARQLSKHRRVASLLLLPLLFAPLEARFMAVESAGVVSARRVVRASSAAVWANIVEVAPLSEREMPRTWLQSFDVPRPLTATVDSHRAMGLRTGHFEGGLRFLERMIVFAPGRELGLKVKIDERALPRENGIAHAFASGLFEIDMVRYRIEQRGNTTEVVLSCDYRVRTTVTPYAHWVARWLLGNFEEQLLSALVPRIERAQAEHDRSVAFER